MVCVPDIYKVDLGSVRSERGPDHLSQEVLFVDSRPQRVGHNCIPIDDEAVDGVRDDSHAVSEECRQFAKAVPANAQTFTQVMLGFIEYALYLKTLLTQGDFCQFSVVI